jgi:probable phosphoglycerate mutase
LKTKKIINMKKFLLVLLSAGSTILSAYQVPEHPTSDAFRKELGITHEKPPSAYKTAHLFLVHHGSTDWSVQKKLQGWKQVGLNQQGKEETEQLLRSLPPVKFSAIYTSSLKSCVETSEILQKELNIPVYPMDELRGEYHGAFDGMTRDKYQKEPHFQFYRSLPAEEEIFFPCGEGGESKADMAKRTIPALKNIAAQHPGENVLVVGHGGLFKFLQYYMGKTEGGRTQSLPYGGVLIVDADQNSIYLP